VRRGAAVALRYLPGAGNCRPITNLADGNAECTMLGTDGGRGYFLLCINLSLAITSVDGCTGDAAPSCVRDPHAADSLATLENNADFLADPTCGDALDGCLARIFGPPDGSFPGLYGGIDAGGSPPPRSTSVSCNNSCSNDKNVTCQASPSCDCSGPSCNNSLSCDSACSSSNDQSGCGGNCNACASSGGGGGGGNEGGGCGGGSSSSGGGCGGGSSSSGGGCGNSCSSSSSSGSGGSSCGGGQLRQQQRRQLVRRRLRRWRQVQRRHRDPPPGIGLAMSFLWGALPIALASLSQRRARRRATPPRDTSSATQKLADPAHAGDAHESPAAVASCGFALDASRDDHIAAGGDRLDAGPPVPDRSPFAKGGPR